jgi:predicted HTH transcriptional regulator
MIAALTKPLEQVVPDDLIELIGLPEIENGEFKRELNRPEPWSTRGDLTESPRRKIFKKLVAFANTSGERLFIGSSETSDGGPPRASAIQPIPRHVDLAKWIEQAVIASIDPPLTFFRVIGVPTEGNAGIVIADIPASYSGLHLSKDLECYARKGTHSIPIGMREIHDLVIRLSPRGTGGRSK